MGGEESEIRDVKGSLLYWDSEAKFDGRKNALMKVYEVQTTEREGLEFRYRRQGSEFNRYNQTTNEVAQIRKIAGNFFWDCSYGKYSILDISILICSMEIFYTKDFEEDWWGTNIKLASS